MSAAPLLQVEDLSIEFGWGASAVKAVRNVSWSVAPGETLAIIGESGSGKSVSTSTILNLLPTPPARITSGRILFDGVDLLINNAGVAVGGPVGEVPLSDWEWLMGINLWGVIYGCHFFLPRMKRAGSGHIINVASIAGVASAAAMAPYNVSKAGVISLSETLAGEFVGTELGVTVLCPYFFKTNIAQAARSTLSGGAQMVEKLMARSKVQAPQVAQLALAAAARGDLYAFPHPESKAIAFMKRSAPELMLKKLGPWLASRSRT